MTRVLSWTLSGFTVWIVILGLWDHDWRMIVAGTLVAVIWTLIGGEVVGDEEPRRW